MQHSFTNFFHQTVDSHTNIIENRLIHGVRHHWIAGRTKQQIPAFHSYTFAGAKSAQRQICIDRNLKRLF